MGASLDELRRQYFDIKPLADRFGLELRDQMYDLLLKADLALAVPIECRTKSWESLAEKLDRKSLELSSVAALPDLVGLRLILLFTRDVTEAVRLIAQALEVVSTEDTGERLGDAQFGYRSHHLIVQLPKAWLAVPTFSGLGGLQAEIQIRTVAQHIWAAASHLLQYKQEESVPIALRRSVSRVSALLETVDLEFDRILTDRAYYVRTVDISTTAEPLNVDVVEKLLSEMLPEANKGESEPYGELLSDLTAFKVTDTGQLRDLITRRLPEAQKSNASEVEKRRKSQQFAGTSKERIEAGVFWTHVGLIRQMLVHEHPRVFDDYMRAKALKRSAT